MYRGARLCCSESSYDFPTGSCLDMAIKRDQQLNFRDCSIVEDSEKEVGAERNFQRYDEDEDGYEFSFVCAEAASSPISADDIFHNGQIRPISPLFGNGAAGRASWLRNPVQEASVERSDQPSASEEVNRVGEESHCGRTETETAAPAPVSCRKSNSTGFSKLWRFRDLLIRSQSDGKETFVFLTENRIEKDKTTSRSSSLKKNIISESSKNDKNSSSKKGKKGSTVAESKTTSPKSKGKTTSSSSSYAMQYGKNGEKGREKRRSFLPYRQDLVGFFTNANVVSRNIHSY